MSRRQLGQRPQSTHPRAMPMVRSAGATNVLTTNSITPPPPPPAPPSAAAAAAERAACSAAAAAASLAASQLRTMAMPRTSSTRPALVAATMTKLVDSLRRGRNGSGT